MSERKRFEHWMSDEGANPKAVTKSANGYRLMQTNISWTAWSASAKANSEREAELLRIIAELKTEASFSFQQYQDLGSATHQADLLSEARFDRLCKDMDRMTDQRDALRAELAQAKPKRASTLPAPRHGPCNYPYWRILEVTA